MLGIGFAATRDLNAFFRYEKADAAGTPNPVAGMVRWGISEGSSQSGAFLRAYIRLGFNQDEAGRIVWEGSNPNIASRVIDLNRRFASPGTDVELYGLGNEAPLWWEDWNDTPRGRGTAGLLDRCRASNTCPKILETFGAAEIWNLRASFMLVGTDAKGDIPLPDNVRRYLFPERHAWRRTRRLQQRGNTGQRLRTAGESGAKRADAIGVAARTGRVGHDRRGDAAEPVSRKSPTARWCPTRRRRSHFPRFPDDHHRCSVRCSITVSAPASTIRTPQALSQRRRRSSVRCRSSSSRSMRTATKWPASSRRSSPRRSAPTPDGT